MSHSSPLARQTGMSSTVTITGATGVIGWRVVARLVGAGCDVRGVVRSDAARAIVEDLGATAVPADVFDRASLQPAFAGSDAVVNLLTHIPPPAQMALPWAWRENDRLRREASAAVADAARAAGAERLVQESLIFLYADGGDRWLDEDAPLDPKGPPAGALIAERHARDRFGAEAVVLRFGAFMAPDSPQTQLQVAQARRGLSPWFTRPDGHLPTVWVDDAAAAVVAALDAPGGIYNVVDDDPPTRREADAALAVHVGRSHLRSPAAPLVRQLPAAAAISRSQRASNRRLRKQTGWAPAVRAGIDGWALVDAAREAVA